MAKSESLTVPSAPETEADILGSCLREGMAWWVTVEQLSEVKDVRDLFYETDHRVVVDAILSVAETVGTSLTPSMVRDALETTTASERLAPNVRTYILNLQTQSTLTSIETLTDSVNLLNQKAILRSQLDALERMAEKIRHDEPHPNKVLGDMQALSVNSGMSEGVRRFGDVLAEMEEQESTEPMSRMRTNLPDLDTLFRGGIDPTRLILFAARPKVGKTTQLLNMMLESLAQDYVVLFASLEIGPRELFTKMLSAHSFVEEAKIGDWIEHRATESVFTPEEFARVQESSEGIRGVDLHTMFAKDIHNGVDSIVTAAYKLVQNFPGRNVVVYIDYIQILVDSGAHDNDHTVINYTMKKLKKMALTLGIIVITASQLSRAGAEGMPSPHQLRGSGGLEEHSDVVILMNRQHLQDETKPAYIMDMHVALNRISGPGWIQANFLPEIQTIADIRTVDGSFEGMPDTVEPMQESQRAIESDDPSFSTRQRRGSSNRESAKTKSDPVAEVKKTRRSTSGAENKPRRRAVAEDDIQ